MLSKTEFIRGSLELNLFFGRIMKEHMIFLASSVTPKSTGIIQQAVDLKSQFEGLLAETLSISNGVISPGTAMSGELVTKYTLNAEMATQFYTGIQINTNITQVEAGLVGGKTPLDMPALEQRVSELNQKAIMLASFTAQFKAKILADVLACKVFSFSYPLLIEHIKREAEFYLRTLNKLQQREEAHTARDMAAEEAFWNQIMGEHAMFIRGMLDPQEEELMEMADNFAKEFTELTKKAKMTVQQASFLPRITRESLKAAREIRDFKAQGTQGILQCKVRSIIVPLLSDHVLREANHFLRVLTGFEKRP